MSNNFNRYNGLPEREAAIFRKEETDGLHVLVHGCKNVAGSCILRD